MTICTCLDILSGRAPADTPVTLKGWVRTGGASTHEWTPGIGNCDNWTQGYTDRGTVIYLDNNWDTINVWQASVYPCYLYNYVWCVED